MSRVTPTSVDVWIDGAWRSGTLRTCEVAEDGSTCSGVVSVGTAHCVTTGRFGAEQMRKPSGGIGCPAAHRDASCVDSA